MGRLRLVLLVLLVSLILAIRFLPGWAWLVLAGVAVLIPPVLRLIIRWKVRSFVTELGAETPAGMPPLFAALFKLKGSVLRKARVVVHSIRPTEAPPLAPVPLEDGGAQLLLPSLPEPSDPSFPPGPHAEPPSDVNSVTETAAASPLRDYYLLEVTIKPTRWGIGFKRWQPGELVLTSADTGWLEDDDSCAIVRVEVEQAGAFGPEDHLRYAGPQRLRLIVGVRRGVSRLVFRYYTEKFGEILLPPARSLPST